MRGTPSTVTASRNALVSVGGAAPAPTGNNRNTAATKRDRSQTSVYSSSHPPKESAAPLPRRDKVRGG